MKVIPLSKGLFAKVDDEDFEKAISYGKWSAVQHRDGYFIARLSAGKIYFPLHQLIMGTKWVDHINHDTLDNQKANLRPATRSQNAANRKLPSNSTSGFKGVSWSADRKMWRARIEVNGKAISLGYYHDAANAAAVYDYAAVKHFGEFALTNESMRNSAVEPQQVNGTN